MDEIRNTDPKNEVRGENKGKFRPPTEQPDDTASGEKDHYWDGKHSIGIT